MSRARDIGDNLDAVRARVRRAEAAAGRGQGSVGLVAVSKTMPADDVAAALAAGQRDFGENYAQELRDKRPLLPPTGQEGPRWHFIGPLQTNKAKHVAGQVELLHTLDTVELLQEADRRAGDTTQGCLVQVNVAGEHGKRGIAPEGLAALLDRFAGAAHLRCMGLMLIPPFGEDPETGRPHFAALRKLRDQHGARSRPNVELAHLSMGMSHDLEVAIAEGATLVRVGTAIFGARRAR